MATRRDLPHLTLTPPTTKVFIARGVGVGGRASTPPGGGRLAHARKLRGDLTTIPNPAPGDAGTYIILESQPGQLLEPDAMGDGHKKIEVVAVHPVDAQGIQRALMFVPNGQLDALAERIEKYSASTDSKPLSFAYDRVAAVRKTSTIRDYWTAPHALLPADDEVVWWELWLKVPHERGWTPDTFLNVWREWADAQEGVARRVLVFAFRAVMWVQTTGASVANIADRLGGLAGISGSKKVDSPATATAFFLRDLNHVEQFEWVEEAARRVIPADDTSPVVAVLDSGVRAQHPLLRGSLRAGGVGDVCNIPPTPHDQMGHGTLMCGLALYGDVAQHVASAQLRLLSHRLESVKILDQAKDGGFPSYELRTVDAVRLVEAEPFKRVFVSAVTTGEAGDDAGRPSAWSAAVDNLAVGGSAIERDDCIRLTRAPEDEEGTHRLFIISAGNVCSGELDELERQLKDGASPMDLCDLSPIHEPAQAWNVLTIGAMTSLHHITDSAYLGYQVIAPPGSLSPWSSTSRQFRRGWPIKPEILFEGGNVASDPRGALADPEELLPVSTLNPTLPKMLAPFNATSAASAQAGHMAGRLMAAYPEHWPETTRALMVHAARWTDVMQRELNSAHTKEGKLMLLRRYGWGVPTLERALHSASDALTLVSEATIKPYKPEGGMREMHLYKLPWPREVLGQLGALGVKLRVVLSYFVEPNPGERGWTQKHRYPSHLLRFDLQRPLESQRSFEGRINAAEEVEAAVEAPGDGGWLLGPARRFTGSLHCDVWEGDAAQLASREHLAIYPVTGWWKGNKKKDRSEQGVRYALIVSIEAPGAGVDLYAEVARVLAAQVALPAAVPVET